MSSHFQGSITADSFIGAIASTAVVADSVTVTSLVMAAGGSIDLDSNTASLTANAATITKRAVVVTTEALTTAALASQALVLTLSGVAATDLVFVTVAGGTNTNDLLVAKAVSTTNTVTITLTNVAPVAALNGTVKLNVLICKA